MQRLNGIDIATIGLRGSSGYFKPENGAERMVAMAAIFFGASWKIPAWGVDFGVELLMKAEKSDRSRGPNVRANRPVKAEGRNGSELSE